jgi:hypothetical protein
MKPNEALSASEQEDLIRAILRRTIGSACSRARPHLAAPAGAPRDPILAALLASHVEHCADCARIAETAERLDALLPSLRAEEPGDGFEEQVFAATVHAARRRRRGALLDWRPVVLRPRFALEAAYVATLLLWLAKPIVAPLVASPRWGEVQHVARAVPDAVAGPAVAAVWTQSRAGLEASRRASLETLGVTQAAAAETLSTLGSTIARAWRTVFDRLHRTFHRARACLPIDEQGRGARDLHFS